MTPRFSIKHVDEKYLPIFKNLIQIILYLFQTKQATTIDRIYFLTFISCGAEILTLPGMFLASTSSLTAFSKSFSRLVQALSFRKIWTAVFEALPRFPDPGVNFTLNLK